MIIIIMRRLGVTQTPVKDYQCEKLARSNNNNNNSNNNNNNNNNNNRRDNDDDDVPQYIY